MLREFCAENATDVMHALTMGVQRIELCDNLAVGGTTPSMGVIESVSRLVKENNAQFVTMIRPRCGHFCYDEIELTIMKTDMIYALKAGSDGLVLGALTAENWLDEAALGDLLEDLPHCQLVFHMAFDLIPRSRQKEAVDWLAGHGFSRILTHGGSIEIPIEQHLDWLKELVAYAANRLTILIGGGVTDENCEMLALELGISEVHGTKIVPLFNPK